VLSDSQYSVRVRLLIERPDSRSRHETVEHKPPRNKRFGVRRKHWEAAINCGTFFSLWVSPMAKPKLDALVAALEAA
jgi:hypothetical protein